MFPFENDILKLNETEEYPIFIRGQLFVIKRAAEINFKEGERQRDVK